MCQLDLARVSEFRSIEWFRTQDTGHRTTGCKPGDFADLTNSTWIAASSTRSRRSTASTRVLTTRWPNWHRSQSRGLMVQTIRAGVWKLKYSWSRSRFSALSTVQRKHRMRRMRRTRLSVKHGRSSTEWHGRPFSSRWRGLCSSSMVFRKMQRRCGISWRRTTSRRWSWMFGLCETRCQLWNWAIVRMYRSTHRRFRVMWMASIFAPIPIAQVVLVVVRCRRVSTPITSWRAYSGMMIGGFHQVDVRQNRHPGRQTRGDCHEVESTRSAITERRRFGRGSCVLKVADEEREVEFKADSEVPKVPW